MDLPSNGGNVRITLEEDEGGKNKVVFSLANGSEMKLSPAQARLLATELIVVVNRAEVRRSLRRSPNVSDKPGASSGDDIDLFQPEFSK
jgi:hypothetical protein